MTLRVLVAWNTVTKVAQRVKISTVQGSGSGSWCRIARHDCLDFKPLEYEVEFRCLRS